MAGGWTFGCARGLGRGWRRHNADTPRGMEPSTRGVAGLPNVRPVEGVLAVTSRAGTITVRRRSAGE
jgi:hypothetical protein